MRAIFLKQMSLHLGLDRTVGCFKEWYRISGTSKVSNIVLPSALSDTPGRLLLKFETNLTRNTYLVLQNDEDDYVMAYIS